MTPYFIRTLYRSDFIKVEAYVVNLIGDTETFRNSEMIGLAMGASTGINLRISNKVFKITAQNKARVVKFFHTVIHWFFDPSMNDLFTYNKENMLTFNMKYSSLKRVVYSGCQTHQFLQAYPAVVVGPDDKDCEGVVLCIENESTAISIPIDDLMAVSDCIADHNFQSEIMLAAFRYKNLPSDLQQDIANTAVNKGYSNPYFTRR